MIHSFKSCLHRILRNNDGSIAVLSAVIIPLSALLLFVTVDTGRVYVVKSKVQESVDSALLAAVATKDTKNIDDEFQQVFLANVAADYAGAQISNATITETVADSVYTATADITVPLSYRWGARSDAQFVVVSEVTIDVTSKDRNIEIAMSLDNTRSMGVGGRIEALRSAATELVHIIFGANATLDNIHVSVVPYDIVVRIGPGRESWIQAPTLAQYSSMAPKGFAANRRSDLHCIDEGENCTPEYTFCPGSTCTTYPGQDPVTLCPGSTCQNVCYPEELPTPPTPEWEETITTCDQETRVCTTQVIVHPEDPGSPGHDAYCQDECCIESFWGGYPEHTSCCTEEFTPATCSPYRVVAPVCPDNGYIDASDTAPTAGESWKFRLPYNGYETDTSGNLLGSADERAFRSSLAPILFASNTKSDIISAINAMNISGATRIHVGLMWGWFTLSPKWQGLWDAARGDLPKTPDADREKVLILMTDGLNFYPTDDPVTAEVCTAVKNSGIILYTVGFGPQSDINEALLMACASDPTKYFYAPTNEALELAFKQIAGSILFPSLRISK